MRLSSNQIRTVLETIISSPSSDQVALYSPILQAIYNDLIQSLSSHRALVTDSKRTSITRELNTALAHELTNFIIAYNKKDFDALQNILDSFSSANIHAIEMQLIAMEVKGYNLEPLSYREFKNFSLEELDPIYKAVRRINPSLGKPARDEASIYFTCERLINLYKDITGQKPKRVTKISNNIEDNSFLLFLRGFIKGLPEIYLFTQKSCINIACQAIDKSYPPRIRRK